MNKKKKEQADQDRKYDSLRIYLGNTSDEWERQRTIIREIAFAVCRAKGKAQARERQACGVSHAVPPPPPVCCGLFDLYQVVGTRCADRHHGLTCRLINFYNCMHSFQCGFEVVFTVNVHCLFYVFFIYFINVNLNDFNCAVHFIDL